MIFQITLKKYDCPSTVCKNQNISLVYVKAEDPKQKNVVQFIWSVYETPSIIVAYTSKKFYRKESDLEINWPKLLQGSLGAIKFNLRYDYIMAFEISEIHEFSDPKDNVIFSKSDFNSHKHRIDQTNWRNPSREDNTFTFEGDFLNGIISFQVKIYIIYFS